MTPEGGCAPVSGGAKVTSGAARARRRLGGPAPRMTPDLSENALEARLGLAVDVGHSRRDARVHARDLGVELTRDRAVARMALAPGAQLDQMHRLAGVQVEHVADAVGEAQRVRRELGTACLDEAGMLGVRALEPAPEEVGDPCGLELLGDLRPEVGREPLPLDGEHAMALQVAEGAVVGYDLEAVGDRLEAAPGAVAAVAPLPAELGSQVGALVGRKRTYCPVHLVLRARRGLEQERGEQVLLTSPDGEQAHSGRGGLGGSHAIEPEARRRAVGRALALLEVGDRAPAALGALNAGEEARDHLLELAEGHPPELTCLGQGRGEQAQDEVLVGLPAREHPDVRQRRGGEQSAQEVERLGADRAAVGGLGLPVAAREALGGPALDARERLGVGVEERVHSPFVLGPKLRVAPVPIAATRHVRVVGYVARRLLEVGGEPPALKDLGDDVRDPLEGEVRAPELGHRVVPVAEEDALVERRRALALDAARRASRPALEVARELIEEQPAERAAVARVAREESALDGLREVDEREDRSVEVREVGPKRGALLVGEGLDRGAHGGGSLGRSAAGAGVSEVRCVDREPRAGVSRSRRLPHVRSRGDGGAGSGVPGVRQRPAGRRSGPAPALVAAQRSAYRCRRNVGSGLWQDSTARDAAGRRTPARLRCAAASPRNGHGHPPRRLRAPSFLPPTSPLVGLLGIPSPLGPLVVWLAKRESHPAIDDQGKEALNFNLSAFLYAVVLGVVGFVFSLTLGFGVFLFLPVFLAAIVAWIVLVIVGATRASKGELYRYPLTIRFIS